jgi:hypothetical protein
LKQKRRYRSNPKAAQRTRILVHPRSLRQQATGKKTPALRLAVFFRHRSMHEQRDQNDDRDWNAEEPQE